jgi:hypothetical protein
MSAWDDLVAVALVGTDQTRPAPMTSAGSTALESLLHGLEDRPVEQRMLAAASVFSTWRRAGMRPLELSAMPAQAPAEDRLPCPEAAAGHLARILRDETLMPVLPQWLAALAAAGHNLPHRWVPEVLDLACRQPDLRPLIRPVLGPRGAWLAAQRQEWTPLLMPSTREAIIERWHNGLLEERLELLRYVRRADPPLGLELVSSTWQQEPPRQRKRFLQTLSAGLSMADEPFLEAALDDRRKDVRLAAAELLAALPGSRLCRRMLDRLLPLLHFTPGGQSGLARLGLGRKPSVEVTLPGECDKAILRDGLDPDGIEGLGVRSGCLAQMLSMVPPEIWCARWDVDPQRALAAFSKTEWEDAFLVGWAHAVARYHDAAWADAVISVLQHKVPQWREQPTLQAGAAAQRAVKLLYLLWPALSPARLEARALESLGSRPHLQNTHVAVSLLGQCRHPWSEALGRAMLQALQRVVREGDSSLDITWPPRQALKEYALYMPPSLAAQAAEGWDRSGPVWNSWSSPVEQFQTILRFRYEMLAALPPTAPA